MLRLLLILSVLLGLVPRSQQQGELFTTTCAVSFYGTSYTVLYLSHSDTYFAVCFTDYYDPSGTGQDCIVGPAADSLDDSGTTDPAERTDEEFKDNLDTLTDALSCTAFIEFLVGGALLHVSFAAFTPRYAMKIRSEAPGTNEFQIIVQGNILETVTIVGAGSAYRDISRCRDSGTLFGYDEEITSNPEVCTQTICDSGSPTDLGCERYDRCDGSGSCILGPICTVSAFSVIDFNGARGTIEDRCMYSLLSGTSVPDFEVKGSFSERRRGDVMFLDSLSLEWGDDVINLLQGSRVTVNDAEQSLPHTVNSMDISKDDTGVLVTLTIGSYTTTIFFDGNTAQIMITGSGDSDVQLSGMCVDESARDSVRLPDESIDDCQDSHTSPPDSSIDCPAMELRCDLMGATPFDSCHATLDATPYITACKDALCDYPAVDDLECQFMEAYSKACSLRQHSLDEWRTDLNCPPTRAFCQDTICMEHEFCAENGGNIVCFCRNIFASPYYEGEELAGPVTCSENSASVSVVGCLLEERNIPYTVFRLNDDTCVGVMDEETHMVNFEFDTSDTCGALITFEGTSMIYTNTIAAQDSSDSDITRQEEIYIDFSCTYTQPQEQSMSFSIMDSSVEQVITSGSWPYTLMMDAFADESFLQAVDSDTNLPLNQRICVRLQADGVEGTSVALVTESCWATDEDSSSGSLRYDMITDGCPNSADDTIAVGNNGVGKSNYMCFRMFVFSRSSGNLYLHCQAQLCADEDGNCVPDCSPGLRRRRSASLNYLAEAPALITMGWTK